VWPELVVCGEAKNGEEALALIERHRPQVAFLDIRMPGLTGLEVADRIGGFCRIVFITAYDDYAVEAFEQEAVDCLLKPVTRERLEKTVQRLRPGLETGTLLPPKHSGGFWPVFPRKGNPPGCITCASSTATGSA